MNQTRAISIVPFPGCPVGERRVSRFSLWAAERAKVAPEDLTIEDVAALPRLRDLPDGPASEHGGYAAEHESVTESELDRLAEMGDRVIEGFGSRSPGSKPD